MAKAHKANEAANEADAKANEADAEANEAVDRNDGAKADKDNEAKSCRGR
jgi:hypothetical protein